MSLACAACDPTGGPCQYRKEAGTCVINQVKGQSGATATTFQFTPNGGTASTDTGSLAAAIVPSGEPSDACLTANHIMVGTSLACTKETETAGTCTPSEKIVAPST